MKYHNTKTENEEDLFLKIASATKDTGMTLHGCKIYSNPYIEDGMLYFVNEDEVHVKPPFRNKKIK